ncbi:MAG TPA: GntR family transcriptional regulator [Solirubrobacterales bacterium]|jgi:GntR family transcriptional regulator|nr:GntR family transcriptional regulator [Solirubrobacterales bacterium]
MAQSATAPNPFAVDPGDELPVGLQLTLRLRALIATGRLPAGERLPSVRRLAEWAGVNLNTVRGVYAGLEAAGLVVSHQGRGTFVADQVRAAPELEEIAAEAIRKALAAGLGARELAEVALVCAEIPGDTADAALPTAPGALDPAEAEAIGVRRELRRQIGVLEAELAGYVRDLPADLPTAPRLTTAHVAGVEELEQTRDTLVAQLSEGRRAAERRAREEARRRVGAEAAPGAEGAGPLARAMGWWRAKR